MTVASPVAPSVAQSTALLEGDDTESEPPQQLSFETPSDFQANPRQGPPQPCDSQSQSQFSDELPSVQRTTPSSLHHDTKPVEQSSTAQSVEDPVASSSPASLSTPLSSLPQAALGNLSSSPVSTRPFPTAEVVAVHDTIPEEDDETDYDTPNEPVTPVSGRQSRDGFHPAETQADSPALPKTETGAVAVSHPLSLPTSHLAVQQQQQQQHKPHSHHGHRNHHNAQRHPRHQRTLSNTSDTADVAHFPPPLSTTTLQSAAYQQSESSTTGVPQESPSSTRPTTAVAGSFLIGPPSTNGNATTAPNSEANNSSPGAINPSPSSDALQGSGSLGRRQSRGNNNASTSSFKRTMSSFFRRTPATAAAPEYQNSPSDSSLVEMAASSNSRKTPTRRWSMHRSLATTQSNSPPSPGSPPLEMVANGRHSASSNGNATTAAASAVQAATEPPSSGSTITVDGNASRSRNTGLPTQEDFLQNDSKKHRDRASTTGLSFHSAIHIVTGGNGPLGSRRNKNKNKRAEYRRRASSFDHASQNPIVENNSVPWAIPAEAGTGLKARRMSLSLPDDFTVDVGELHNEYEYQHMMGRHRRHLGKGATSKVTLMFRKGFPEELYAVKEFRGKSSSETPEEYEKKVKSEYSIAKSLHHPNIVETFRLCTDHGRWNHVMEYCQEGDLYSMVEKKYLRTPEREKDRLCLFKQLIQGLNYLHHHGIAHRDIKLENLLITNNSKLKITDFGASDIFSGTHPGLRSAGGRCGHNSDQTVRLCKPGICGSLPYISPEVLDGKVPYDPRKLDVWAAAIVLIHLFFGGPLWSEARVGNSKIYDKLLSAWGKWNRDQLPGVIEADRLHAEKVATDATEATSLAEATPAADAAAPAAPTATAESAATKPATPATPASVASSTGAPLTQAVSMLSISEVATTTTVETTSTPTAPATKASAPTAAETAAAATAAAAAAAASAAANGTTAAGERPIVDAAPIGRPNFFQDLPMPYVPVLDQFINPPVLRRILLHMLNPDPTRRLTIEQVANLRWFRGIECCQPEAYEDPLAPAVTAANARGCIDAKRSKAQINGQKIYCHNHLPPKTHSHAIVRNP
ncbi:hypothetical protein SBRCBS47491_005300 [Sporothrix bragantina]|uniref:Protein kinase domain-containing protein n=1 Tax=Sporothrix bragantina TaxID=671064 RepID=A0ABP0BWE1_9PEZI